MRVSRGDRSRGLRAGSVRTETRWIPRGTHLPSSGVTAAGAVPSGVCDAGAVPSSRRRGDGRNLVRIGETPPTARATHRLVGAGSNEPRTPPSARPRSATSPRRSPPRLPLRFPQLFHYIITELNTVKLSAMVSRELKASIGLSRAPVRVRNKPQYISSIFGVEVTGCLRETR